MLGLVRPRYVNERTGYRFYTESELDRIHIIQMLKALGLTLEEIQYEFETLSAKRYLELLGMQRAKLQKEIEGLTVKLKKAASCENELMLAMEYKVGECFIKKGLEVSGTFIPLYDQRREMLRMFYCELNKRLGIEGFSGAAYRVLSRQNLLNGNYRDYMGLLICGIACDSMVDYGGEVINIPERYYACCYCPLPRPKSDAYWSRLAEYISGEGYEIAGNGLKRIILEKGMSVNESEYISLLSIPIIRKSSVLI